MHVLMQENKLVHFVLFGVASQNCNQSLDADFTCMQNEKGLWAKSWYFIWDLCHISSENQNEMQCAYKLYHHC